MANSTQAQEYKKAAQIPLLWQLRARDLIAGANVLRARSDASRPRRLTLRSVARTRNQQVSVIPANVLYGLAVENVVKGLLVAQGTPATVRDVLNPRLFGHDLIKLFKRARLPRTQTERETLRNLRWWIETGKYPIGTKPETEATTWHYLTVNQGSVGRLLTRLEGELRRVSPPNTVLAEVDPLFLGLPRAR